MRLHLRELLLYNRINDFLRKILHHHHSSYVLNLIINVTNAVVILIFLVMYYIRSSSSSLLLLFLLSLLLITIISSSSYSISTSSTPSTINNRIETYGPWWQLITLIRAGVAHGRWDGPAPMIRYSQPLLAFYNK